MDNCDARTRAYANGKTFDQCKGIAESLCSQMEIIIEKTGEVSWKHILEEGGHDELVYKLTLKYLRRDGYDIGDWKSPRVTKISV